jgi:hypothetical protein
MINPEIFSLGYQRGSSEAIIVDTLLYDIDRLRFFSLTDVEEQKKPRSTFLSKLES